MSARRWNTSLEGPPSESVLRRKLEDAGYRVSRYTYSPGTHFPEHIHDVDKIDAVVSGQFEIVLGGRSFILGPGDWIEVPRGGRHSATVIGDEPVVSLDAVRTARG